jgi:hypothetical protein
VGKGYLKISFDRVIVPTGDIPLPAKVIQAKGYKVDKQGDIKGNGHATRDVVEWMIPPLWPWKVISLPARGPRPTIKGEEPLELRLMDDIVVPRNLSAQAGHVDRPPYASSNLKPSGFTPNPQATPVHQAVAAEPSGVIVNENIIQASMPMSEAAPSPESMARVTILVLKSNQVLEVTRYMVDSGLVKYRETNGTEGSVDASQIDWLKTTEMTSEVRSVDLPVITRQTN